LSTAGPSAPDVKLFTGVNTTVLYNSTGRVFWAFVARVIAPIPTRIIARKGTITTDFTILKINRVNIQLKNEMAHPGLKDTLIKLWLYARKYGLILYF